MKRSREEIEGNLARTNPDFIGATVIRLLLDIRDLLTAKPSEGGIKPDTKIPCCPDFNINFCKGFNAGFAHKIEIEKK